MAKLYYKYGVVNSSKSANALMTIHNYEEQGMKVFLIKSVIDTRDGGQVKSRAIKDTKEVNAVVTNKDNLYTLISYNMSNGIDVVIIDECQFLCARQINELRRVVDELKIPVICYGLKTDFKTHLFDSSKRLLELADSFQEIKTVCSCGSKAIFNARVNLHGDVMLSGDTIQIGGNDMYKPMCSKCFYKKSKNSSNDKVMHSFLENKEYLESLAKKIERMPKQGRGVFLNEVLCAHYYLERLLDRCSDDSFTEELENIKLLFDSVLESATAHDLLVAQKRANARV